MKQVESRTPPLGRQAYCPEPPPAARGPQTASQSGRPAGWWTMLGRLQSRHELCGQARCPEPQRACAKLLRLARVLHLAGQHLIVHNKLQGRQGRGCGWRPGVCSATSASCTCWALRCAGRDTGHQPPAAHNTGCTERRWVGWPTFMHAASSHRASVRAVLLINGPASQKMAAQRLVTARSFLDCQRDTSWIAQPPMSNQLLT